MPTKAFLHFATDFGPVGVLFLAGRFFDFFTAITFFLGATIMSVLLTWGYTRQIPRIPLAIGLFILVFGTASVLLTNSDIIIFADTIYYSAGALLLCLTYWRQHLVLKSLFHRTFAISDEGWRILTRRWLLVFIVAAVLNELVRINLSPEAWIDFKFYKVIFITLFGLYQFRLASSYRILEVSNRWGVRTSD